MTLTEAIKHAGRFSISPTKYAGRFGVSPTTSIFGVTSQGEYSLILSTKSVTEAVQQFKSSAINPVMGQVGLDVRVEGVTIQFDRA